MHSIKLTIQYDGTNYFGWQRQDNLETIQGEIEKALSKIYKTNINIVGAGRTDRGVHALNQIAHFQVDKYLDTEIIKKAINSILKKDIRISSCNECPNNFHSRFSAKSREYKYIIYNNDFCPPFLRNYRLFSNKNIDCQYLDTTLEYFKGEHDFSSFTVFGEPSHNKIRYIYDIGAERKNKEIIITIKANAFLRKMVRMIIGTCLKLSVKNNINTETKIKAEIERLFKVRNRKLNKYPTVPASGLFLNKICY